MSVPDINQPYVRSFCQTISDSEPVIVELDPLPGMKENECFANVIPYLVDNGGRSVIGWALWEWPGVMIEAEFHCVWERPDGVLVDLTPKPEEFDSIVFLPDPSKMFLGCQVDNIRKPFVKSLYLKEFLSLHRQLFKELNKGDKRFEFGEVEGNHKILKIKKRITWLQIKLVDKFGMP